MRRRGAPLRPSAPWAAGTAVAVGDRGRETHPTLPSGEAAVLPAPKFVLQAGPTFAGEPLLERAMAAPGAPDSPKVYHLTESKRFGAPLAAYLARAHPDLCAAGHPRRLERRPPCPCLAHGALPKLAQLGILPGQRTQEPPPRHSRVATISGHLARWSLLDGSRVRLGPPAKRGAET